MRLLLDLIRRAAWWGKDGKARDPVACDTHSRAMATDPLFPSTTRLIRFAVPAMLAGVTVPLMGMVDVAVLGRLGDPAIIAAVGVAATMFTVIAWSFSFLRFTTTGLVAQAAGRDDVDEVVVQGLRPLVAAVVGGVVLIALQGPLVNLGLALIAPEPGVAALAREYFAIRIMGLPFTLALYALLAWVMGVGSPRTVLLAQLFMNGVNATLTIWFVLGLGWGVAGSAWGTVAAEMATTGIVVAILLRRIPLQRWVSRFGAVLDGRAWRYLLSANGDLVVRTVLLTLSLALLSERGARLGTLTLAANQVLMQFYLLIATVIDGVALAAEVHVGRAVGAGNAASLRHVVRRSSVMALGWGLFIALLVAGVPNIYLPLMTISPALVSEARRYWPWQVLLPIAGVWAFLWDGVYFGATRTRVLRNSMIVSAALFVAAVFVLGSLFGNHGLWLALVLQLVARAGTLTLGWPALVRAVETRGPRGRARQSDRTY